MNKLLHTIALITLLLVATLSSHATLKLPALFTDHMVLQREIPVPVWGWADPGVEVTVKLADQIVAATTGDDGKWKVMLQPLQVAESLNLTVKGKGETLIVMDVAVGEVWLASGQSNMGFPLGWDINTRRI